MNRPYKAISRFVFLLVVEVIFFSKKTRSTNEKKDKKSSF